MCLMNTIKHVYEHAVGQQEQHSIHQSMTTCLQK